MNRLYINLRMKSTKARIYLIAVVAVTLFSLLPVVRNGFVNWDDNVYVYENPAIRTLSPAQIKSFFTSFYAANYHPLVFVSYAVEHRLFKLDPRPYHLTNLVLHLANCALVFLLIFMVTRGNPFVSACTALLFGIHPLHVESVAWISCRKDVLYALFFLSAAIVYVRSRSRENGSARLYWLSLLLFLCSLLSKPMAVTLPVLLLLLIDWYWAREKLSGAVVRMIPFFFLSTVFIVLTVRAQSAFNALRYDRVSDLADNILNATRGLIFYLVKALVPVGLSCLYPTLDNFGGMLSMALAGAVPILVLLAAAVWFSGRYSRKIVFGSLFFLLTILPVLHLVPIGRAVPADRYTYLPLIGIFYIAAEGLDYLLSAGRRGRGALKVALAAGTITLAVMSWNRAQVWKDSVSLWNNAIRNHGGLSAAYYNRGLAHRTEGDYDSAMADYNRAIALRPDYADVYNNRANIYLIRKQYEPALRDYSRAIELMSEEPANGSRDRDLARIYNNRAYCCHILGDQRRARADLDRARSLGLVPDPQVVEMMCRDPRQ